MQGATSTVKPLNAAHRATLRMWQRLQHINAEAASSTLTDTDASQLREDLATWHRQAVTLARKQRARPGRSGRGLQKSGCLPGPQDLAKAPPLEPQTRAQLQSSEGSLLTPQEGHQDLCEAPTVEPHSFFAARHDKRATWQAHRQHPPAQGSTHWICPSGGLEAVCFHSRSQPGCTSELTGRAPPMPCHRGT